MATVNEKMTAIANEIRGFTGETGKLSLDDMASDIGIVHAVGRSEGMALAQTKPYIDTSQITDFYYFCYGDRRNQIISYLDTSSGTSFDYMFCNCKNLAAIPELNVSRGTSFNSMFASCSSLAIIPPLDTSNGTNFSSMFRASAGVTTIQQLDVSKGTSFSSMFASCTNLTSLTFTGIIPTTLDLKSAPLNKASIKNVIEHLSIVASGKTLTLNKTAVNSAFGIDVEDETTYPAGSEYYNLRNSKSNWTISYS